MYVSRQPTSTDTTAHFNSDHHVEHKYAAYGFCINGMHQPPLTSKCEQKEVNVVIQVAQSNVHPNKVIAKLCMKIRQNPQTAYSDHTESQCPKAWTICSYHSLLMRKVTDLTI